MNAIFLKNLFGTRINNNKIRVLSPLEFKDAIKKKGVQLIDVKTPQEFTLGMIKWSQNLNFFDGSSFERGTKKLNKEAAIYVYCQSGSRSKRASKALIKMGFSEIFDFQSGFSNWF
tara:strand:+ start:267 stop:614 length:348 start_codon:yes stop_codon:yes gene_type:complete